MRVSCLNVRKVSKKALRQASVLLGVVELYVVGFNIKKDIFNGVSVQLEALIVGEDQPWVGEPRAVKGRPVCDEADGEEEVVVEEVANDEDEDAK